MEVYRNGRGACDFKGNHTTGLVEDRHGNIWFGTEMGLNVWWFHQDCFQFLPLKDVSNQIIYTLTYPFYTDSLSIWYFNDSEGIVRYFPATKEKEIISSALKYSQTNNRVNTISYSSDGQIWIREEKGIIRLDPESKKQRYFFSSHPENLLGTAQPIYCIWEAKNNNYWLGADQKLIRLNPETREETTYDFSHWLLFSKIGEIKGFRDSLLWLGSAEEGSLIFNPRTLEVLPFTKDNGLTNHSCANLLIDEENIVWLNVDPNGINQIIRNSNPFQNFTAKNLGDEQFSNLVVKRFMELPNGKIWIGTELSGIFLFNPATNSIEEIVEGGQPHQEFSNQGTAFWLEKGEILWIGTFFGISRFHLKTKKFLDKITLANDSDANTIWDFLETQDETLWVATDAGIYYKTKDKEKLQKLEKLGNIRASRFQQDEQGRLFIFEQYNGIHLLETETWNGVPKNPKVRHLFPNRHIKHFYLNPLDQILWLATGKGLVKAQINPDWSNAKILKTYSTAEGLPSDFIYSIVPDQQGDFWLSTNRGLVRFSPKSEQFYAYSPDDGLQDYEYNTNAFLKSKMGTFYFGGVSGFNTFNPTDIEESPLSPRPEFIDLKVNEQPFKDGGYVGAISQLELSHQQNTIEITFVSPDYFNKGRNEYQYQLKNYDKNWIRAGKRNFARYTKLPPGDYTFLVKSSNSHTWNPNVKELAIKILPPWWQTNWAYALYILLVCSLLYGVYQFLLNKKLSEAETNRLRELDQVKTKLYTNITHEFRTPLTVINGMVDELEIHPQKEASKKLGLIKKNSHRLLQMVNQMLQLSKLQAGKESLHLKQEDIIVFTQYLVEAYQSLANSKNISLQFYSEEDKLLMDFDAKKLETILTNLLSNAIKFTREYGRILVVAKKTTSQNTPILEIQVRDNGIGIAAEQLPHIFDRFHQVNSTNENQGTGIGLALVKELVNTMGGSIEVTSILEKETVFYIKFPIHNKAPLIESKVYPTIHSPSILLDVKELTPERLVLENEQPILLIIEDNLDVIYYLQACLEEHYQIRIARNGKEGIDKAFEIIPDIIISDVMMPKMDGFEVCAALKEDERTNHIPIILLTAKADTKDKLTGLSKGADAYLIKPFEKAELLIRLEKLLSVRQILQQKHLKELNVKEEKIVWPENQHIPFIKQVEQHILLHLADDTFSVNDLAKIQHLSRSQIHRKIKALTGMSTSLYIQHLRLLKAKELVATTDLSISEIVYQVGFKSPAYFSQLYKAAFGASPSSQKTEN